MRQRKNSPFNILAFTLAYIFCLYLYLISLEICASNLRKILRKLIFLRSNFRNYSGFSDSEGNALLSAHFHKSIFLFKFYMVSKKWKMSSLLQKNLKSRAILSSKKMNFSSRIFQNSAIQKQNRFFVLLKIVQSFQLLFSVADSFSLHNMKTILLKLFKIHNRTNFINSTGGLNTYTIISYFKQVINLHSCLFEKLA